MKADLMIVDDSEDQIELMQEVFKIVAPRIKVTSAPDGDSALRVLREDPDSHPKVILLDIRMPGMTGIEVLKEIKSDPQLKAIPICMLSSGDLEDDICESYKSFASQYFRKASGLKELKDFAQAFCSVWFAHASHCR